MNSKRQVKSKPKKSTNNKFVFTEPQLDNDGNFQFTEPAKKKSKLMIFLIASGGVVLLLALAVLAKGLLSSHKDDVAEESSSGVLKDSHSDEIEFDTKLTTYEGFDISQITDPPLVASKHRPGESKTLYCKGLAFVFRWCPPGRFMMGSPSSEYPPGNGHCYLNNSMSDSMLDAMGEVEGWSKQYTEQRKQENREYRELVYSSPDFKSHGRSVSEALHPVTLTEGFWMHETEITNLQYDTIIKNEKPKFYENEPCYGISWDFAQKFCKECSQLGMKVQLPTEAQWEYACRAGTQTAFSFGDSYDELYKYGNYCDASYSTYNDLVNQSLRDKDHNDGYYELAPVKSFRPNAWGLYDMHGNAAEWCSDPFGGYIIEHEVNPTGEKEYKVIEVGDFCKTLYDTIVDRNKDKHVSRGGNCLYHFVMCRSASRDSQGYKYTGFRVMMTDKSMNEALA
ncbi:MAG: formylglycine-generating enzyme family protein, partial [Thermoguttaceae bacterium]|nr:formylglycine-generating enzyme family protein [Thermoguttaceae bacterium]